MKITDINTTAAMANAQNSNVDKVTEGNFEETLKTAQENGDTEKLKQVCEDFESIFMNMMFQSMRKTIVDGGLTEKSHERGIYESMLDEELSKSLAADGGIGLADMMYKQLVTEYGGNEDENNISTVDLEG